MSSGIANPQFKGDRSLLVKVLEGKVGQTPPPCFSDPDLESGVCNPMLPLRRDEPFLCAFHKSCLAARLIASQVPFQRVKEIAGSRSPSTSPLTQYEELLAEGDVIFDRPPIEPSIDENEEILIRQKLRAQVVAMNLTPVRNSFRKKSLRFIILDILNREWISLDELRAAVIAIKPSTKCLDLVIGQVTNIATQERNGYRIVEAFGKYRAFGREDS